MTPFRMWRSFRSHWPGLLWRLRRALASVRSDAEERELERLRHLAPGTHEKLLVVHRGRRMLRLYECAGGKLSPIRTYRVGVGRCDSVTPRGQFAIQTMLKDPVWHVPDDARTYGALAGRQVAPDAPENRVAARWMGFSGGIGIHGTRPGRLGIGASDGCVLMSVPDVIDLYARVEPDVPIIVY